MTIYQGTSELGKDIVMWKLGHLGERVNYAVVAKATRISADDGSELREALARTSADITFPIRLTIAKGCPVHATIPSGFQLKKQNSC